MARFTPPLCQELAQRSPNSPSLRCLGPVPPSYWLRQLIELGGSVVALQAADDPELLSIDYFGRGVIVTVTATASGATQVRVAVTPFVLDQAVSGSPAS